jgi:tetratricopeptide (TPR) repeat protein
VNGVGGIGKSSLARLYTNKHYNSFNHIVWLTATNLRFKELIESSTLPENLGIDRQGISKKQLLTMVAQQLKNLSGYNLFIIDNADNTEEIVQNKNFLPLGSNNWEIIITSRGTIDGFENFMVNALSMQDAQTLFLTHYPAGKKEVQVLEELLNLIERHTLTIELMAKTLAKSRRLKNVAELLEKVKNKAYEDSKLLKEVWVEHKFRWAKDSIHKQKTKGVYQYLLAVFDLAELNKDKQWLLKQFAILPAKPLKTEIFFEWFALEEDNIIGELVDNTLTLLVQEGWLQTLEENEEEYILLHPLLKELILFKLPPSFEDCEQLTLGFCQYIQTHVSDNNLVSKLSFADSGDVLIRQFFPESSNINVNQLLPAARLYNAVSLLHRLVGRFDKALKYNNIACALGERLLLQLSNVPTTIKLEIFFFQSDLASTLKEMGEYNQAIDVLEKLVKNNTIDAGKYQSHLIAPRATLAAIYQEIENYQGATTLFEENVKQAIIEFGTDNPQVANNQNGLGWTYILLGDFNKSIELLEKALSSTLSYLDEEHPLVSSIQSNLGWAYYHVERLEDARKLLEKALRSNLKNFGELSINTSKTRSSLGWVYRELGKVNLAVEQLEATLKTDLLLLDKDHNAIATTRNNLGDTYRLQGKHKEAKEMLEAALESDLANFGSSSYAVGRDSSNLGHLYFDMGKFRKAVGFYEKSLKCTIAIFKKQHPETARDYYNLAFGYEKIREYKKAKNCMQSSYKISKSLFGEDDPRTKRVKQQLDNLKKLG